MLARFVLPLVLLLIAPSLASALCVSADEIVKQQSAQGIVTAITGEVAQQIVAVIWQQQGKQAPEVDEVVVTALYNGSVNLLPVFHGQVCLSAATISPEALHTVLANLSPR